MAFIFSRMAKKHFDNIYDERVTYFRELNKYAQNGATIFLGDSITESFRVNEFFPTHYVINRGIYGDTTDGLLARMKESIFDLEPLKIFLLIGTNDLGRNRRDSAYIIHNIARIIEQIQEKLPDTEIYIESVYPVTKIEHEIIDDIMVGTRKNKDIKIINEGLKALTEEKNITYIDVYSYLINDNGDLKLEYTTDGLHISPLGYSVVVEIIKQYI